MHNTHRFPALSAAPPPAGGRLWLTRARLAEPHVLSAPARIWLVLQRGALVAGQALINPAP